MNLMYPQILWGLLALSIPIIVHLFNFRKFRKVEFSNVSFLKEVQQETKSKSKIKHFLILLSRMLAIACLVLAFAQPYIPLNESDTVGGKKSISVYIDNSFSMDGEGEEGRLIEVAKNKARELVSNYGATDQFQLLTNDFEGRHQRFVSQEDALELIDEIQMSPQGRLLEEVISRQRELMIDEEGEKISFVLSDLQKATHKIDRIVKDSLMEVRFLPQSSLYPNNIYIDSAWFETPVRALNQPEALHVRIKHSSQEIIENIPISLVINGNRKSLGSFSIQPGQATDTTLTFTQTEPGIKSGYLKIDDYPITFDDVFFLSYEVAESIRILHIEGNDNGSFVNKVFSNDHYYTLTTAKAANINYGDFSNHDLIIVDQVDQLSSGLILELEKFTSNGGTTFCIPAKNGNSRSYAELSLSMGGSIVKEKRTSSFKIGAINLEHFLYSGAFEKLNKNIDLPKGNAFYPIQKESKSGQENLLTLQSGEAYLSCFEHNNGRFYFLGSSLNPQDANFAQHALFVPTMLRVAEFSQSNSPLWHTVGDETVVNIANRDLESDEVFRIKNLNGGEEFIPESRNTGGRTELFTHTQVSSDGNYELLQSNQPFKHLSFNFNRKESDMQVYETSEWSSLIEEANWDSAQVMEGSTETLGKFVSDLDEGRKLWWLFIALAAAFLFIEIIFIKLF